MKPQIFVASTIFERHSGFFSSHVPIYLGAARLPLGHGERHRVQLGRVDEVHAALLEREIELLVRLRLGVLDAPRHRAEAGLGDHELRRAEAARAEGGGGRRNGEREEAREVHHGGGRHDTATTAISWAWRSSAARWCEDHGVNDVEDDIAAIFCSVQRTMLRARQDGDPPARRRRPADGERRRWRRRLLPGRLHRARRHRPRDGDARRSDARQQVRHPNPRGALLPERPADPRGCCRPPTGAARRSRRPTTTSTRRRTPPPRRPS